MLRLSKLTDTAGLMVELSQLAVIFHDYKIDQSFLPYLQHYREFELEVGKGFEPL